MEDLDNSIVVPHDTTKWIADRWIGKHVVVNAKAGSYFGVLKSIKLDESSLHAKVEDSWRIDLGRQRNPGNKFIKDYTFSSITASHAYGGREFEIKDVINIDVSDDTINQMHRVIRELK